ncbi:hypothetical protein KLP28_13425 [Nocardioidaceae bacterium]|nr:hypothetical protein KLP28_13425 [Nocardioidaceae bacterium]
MTSDSEADFYQAREQFDGSLHAVLVVDGHVLVGDAPGHRKKSLVLGTRLQSELVADAIEVASAGGLDRR